jgi:hypothetical protein
MSWLDDHYEEMEREMSILQASIEEYVNLYSAQEVVRDAIQSFKEEPVDEWDETETKARDILKTIARTKRVTDKQKYCLVKMLVYRGENGYEPMEE